MRRVQVAKTILLSISIVVSCSDNKLSREDFIRWVESVDNGLKQTKIQDNIEFTLQYRPITYVALKELRIKNPTHEGLKGNEIELDEYMYFDLQIKKDTVINKRLNNNLYKGAYLNQSAYFDLYMSSHIRLVQGRDTLSCSMFHFESDGGLRPFYHFLIAFEKRANQDTLDKEFIYDDNIIVKQAVSFTVKAFDINKIPSVKL